MQVDWAIPCRFVEVQQPYGATIVGAGSDLVMLPQVPAPVQVLFAVRYVGMEEDLDGEAEHPFACRIYQPNGQKVGEQGGRLKAIASLRVSGYAADLIVPAAVVLDVREYGTYSVEFSIDDSNRRVPIHVVPPQEPPD